MDEQLQQISGFLRGQKTQTRMDDPRQWADYLDRVIQPQLDELARLQAATKKKATA